MSAQDRVLIEQMKQVAEGLGETFAPFCEVVLHDLTDPTNAIVAIHNNLSGRGVGEPATELGLARIADPEYPQIIANYANSFADGRQAKSTSIGIRNAEGDYVAALCMNVDLTLFQTLASMVGRFAATENAVDDTLAPTGAEAIRARIDAFAAGLSSSPRALRAEERRALMRELKEGGLLDVRRSADVVAAHLGVSRATVYADAR